MKPFVKICGLREREHIETAIEAGADALGFVFVESVRELSIEQAIKITENIPQSIFRVAVFLNPVSASWDRIAKEFKPDAIQTDASDFEFLNVPSHIAQWPVFREHQQTINVPKEGPFIYEGRHSGKGELVDWHQAALIAKKGNLILAGGLNCNNVIEAIETVRPYGVDVSSAVESSPGKKDITKIRQFIKSAKSIDVA
ncbi:MAG: phosphoribosylanthranilate isomerase [Pseudomonadota bacterium]|nr:phosphoribosylanthranilate isomerase [Pseudomonadota bacterium]